MRIAICGSLEFYKEMHDVAEELGSLGHKPEIPFGARRIMGGEWNSKEIEKQKESEEFHKEVIKVDAIRKWAEVIKNSDAILVLNYDNKSIKNRIGATVYLEIGFAHIFHKKIFLLNPIPEMMYKDDIMAMQPKILEGDLNKIS